MRSVVLNPADHLERVLVVSTTVAQVLRVATFTQYDPDAGNQVENHDELEDLD